MGLSPELLLVRGGDLVLVGVRWFGFDLITDPATGRSKLVAVDDPGRLTLTFPPQAIGEEKGDGFSINRRDARVSGPTTLQYSIPIGHSVPLSAEGLLQALHHNFGTVISLPDEDDDDTEIEIPWHLVVAVLARTPQGRVISDHAVAPVISPSGVSGLWHARLRAVDGTDADARLSLHSRNPKPDVGLDTAPLSAGHRERIFQESARHLADVTRLELSALGGSFSANAVWPTLRWDHKTVLGRDEHVRVESNGILYPFGHRAVLVQTAVRTFMGGSAAAVGLQRRTVLTVSESIRAPVTGNPSLARTFPFAEVEILAREFSDLKTPKWHTIPRKQFAPGALDERLNSLLDEQRPLGEALQAIINAQSPTFPDYAESDQKSAPEFRQARADAGAAEAEHNGLIERQADIDRQIDHLDPTTDQDAISALIAERPTNQEIFDASQRSKAAQLELDRMLAVIRNEFDNLPRNIADLERQRDPDARRWRELQDDIDAVRDEIVELVEAKQHPLEVFFTPQHLDNSNVLFPFRFAGANGDVFFSTPLIFVEDINLPATEQFQEFVSLTNSDVKSDLETAWAPLGRIALTPSRMDLVRSSNPQPGDIHEVHELNIVAEQHDGVYRPKLSQVTVELPAVRALVPGAATRVPLQFTQDFIDLGDSVKIALEPLAGRAIDINFTDRPDRSGGLVSPRFTADAISRTLGPVAKAALPTTGLPNLSAAYKDATLLGFPLSSLIAVSQTTVPAPPQIIPILENGQQTGALISWPNLKLAPHGPFRPRPGSTLALTVENSRVKTQTTCTVSAFDLVLPPGGPELLKVGFTSVEFTQQPGRDPDLQITGLTVDFLGSLQLLKEVSEALKPFLGGPPAVRVSQSGITAGFAFTIPTAAPGVFVIRNIAVSIGIDVPFSKKPIMVSLGFARRENPFNVSVLAFGGGGYIEVQVGGEGLTRIEASIEFGASIEVNFVIASAEVHALGGIHFVKDPSGEIVLGGFIRIGGSVEVLGLVSVSVELIITLNYESARNRLIGHATLVIEVDLPFFSESVTLDSGEWVLAGTEPSHPLLPVVTPAMRLRSAAFDQWQHYREAFAS